MVSHHRRAEDEIEQDTSEEQPAAPVTEKPIAERIAELDAQRRELAAKLEAERIAASKARKSALLQRNDAVSKEGVLVVRIQREIYAYNKLSKKRKSEFHVISKIASLIEESANEPNPA